MLHTAVYSLVAAHFAIRPRAPMMTSDFTHSESYAARLRARIDQLAEEHRELDRLIGLLLSEPIPDELRVRRLKKRKLLLKDQITALRRELDPDTPA